MLVTHPLPDRTRLTLRHATIQKELQEVLTPKLRLGPLAALVDTIVQDPASVQFNPTERVDFDLDTLGPQNVDHPRRIEIDERVACVEKDSPDQKKTGSLYDPKTSSIAARIS